MDTGFSHRVARLIVGVALATASAGIVTTGAAAATTITQSTPTSGSTAQGTAFTDQLATTDANTVTFTTTSTLPSGVTVSSSGAIAVATTTPVGSYTLSGTDSDTASNTGTWSYSLSVTNSGVTQTGTTSATITQGATWSVQLQTSDTATVTYSIMPPTMATGFGFTSSGVLSASSDAPAGSYVYSGTVTDAYGNSSQWNFSLTISNAGITQSMPYSGSGAAGTTATYQLAVSDGGGSGSTVSYTATTSTLPSGVSVSSGGLITVANTVPMGTYTISGTDSDTYGNTGSWSFSISATSDGVAITQTTPTSGSVVQGTVLSDQLATSDTYAVTYVASGTLPSGVTVSASGAIVASTSTAVGVYTLLGTDSDAYGGAGTWSFSLTVLNAGITQNSPTSASSSQGSAFSGSVSVTDNGDTGATVSFTLTTTGLPSGLTVSSAGAIAADASVPVGTYALSGTDSDSMGNTGTWSYTLTVSNAGITQIEITAGSGTQGSLYVEQLYFTDNGNPSATVSFTLATTGLPSGLTVSNVGTVEATTSVPVGTYALSGALADNYGNTGTWSFTLTVKNAGITQSSPTSGGGAQGAVFNTQLATSDANTVTYAVTGTLPSGVTVSSSGAISAAATVPVGTYALSGTDSDSLGNSGTWSFSLTVKNAGITFLSGGSSAPQGTAIGFQMSTGDSNTVTFVATSALPSGVTVSSTGLVDIAATAIVGSYTLSGTDSDTMGNTSTWSYPLTITNAGIAQSSPTSGTTQAGTAFTDQLASVDSGASSAVVTYSATASSLPSGVTVSTSGGITATSSVPMGSYSLAGTDSDQYGNTGTWSYALTVTSDGATITQSVPTSGATVQGTAFSDQLASTGQSGVESFTATSSLPSGVTVSSSGAIAVANTVPVGNYTLSGTDSDTFGGSGTWTYALSVTNASALGPPIPLANRITLATSTPTKVQPGATWTPGASAWSRGPVSLSSSTPSVCTIEGSEVHFVTSGTCVIAFASPGMGAYAAAPTLTERIHVGSSLAGTHVMITNFAGPIRTRPGTLSAQVRAEAEHAAKTAMSHRATKFSLLWAPTRGLTREETLNYVRALHALVVHDLEQREHHSVSVHVHAVMHLRVPSQLRFR